MKPWAEDFYNSERWRACRDGFLKSAGYLCSRCSTPDNPTAAKIAHHKIYLTRENIGDPEVSLSWDNLEALCQQCHNKEHHRTGARRYAFDMQGNITPPMERENKGGETPRADGEKNPAGARTRGAYA